MTCLICGKVADKYATGLVGMQACEQCARDILTQCHRDGGHPSNEHAGECDLCDDAREKGEAEEAYGMETMMPYTNQEAYDHENPPLPDDPMEWER